MKNSESKKLNKVLVGNNGPLRDSAGAGSKGLFYIDMIKLKIQKQIKVK